MTRTQHFLSRLILVTATILVAVPAVRAQYALQYGAAVAVEGRQAFVGEGRNLLLPGSVFVYDVAESGRWEERGVLTGWDGNDEADGFGRTIAVSQNTLLIGAPTVKRVFVFERAADGSWTRKQVIEGESDTFGGAVAVSGEMALVGTPGGRQDRGSVSVLTRRDGNWQVDATLVPTDTTRGSLFGAAVAISFGVAVVGAPNASQRTGMAYVFERGADGWGEGHAIEMPAPMTNDRFGAAVAFAGDRIAVSAPGRDRQMGAVASFVRDGASTSWSFDRRFAAPSSSGGEMFGQSIASNGAAIFVGAPGFANREGTVWQFDIGDERAVDVSTINATESQYRGSFGSAVAANDQLVLVGAVGHDNFEGAAFPFVRSGGMLAPGDRMINNSGYFASVTGGAVECNEGAAEDFGCSEVDMLSFLSRDDIGARRGIQVNDVWGWEDPDTGKEIAIVGRTDGTSFIDLTDPYNPVYLGDLPKTSTANQSIWRDIKVYKNHAFIVSDGAGAHHMQIFDLTQLRRVTNPPQTFEVTALYKGIYSSHNIVINEETGFAYAVGSDSGGETCGGALHMINIQDPVNPKFAGCFADVRTGRGTGATHDAQCVLYRGPDADYSGREICLSSNGSALSIADVTDKDNPTAISIAEYPNVAYTHQGWLTDDHRYFYLNDEGDEVSNLVEGTRTLILDLHDLDDPVISGEYVADHNSIDHNLYVRGNTMYQTNYSAGLRLLDISDPENPVEVGHFDTVPYGKNDNSPVLGAWSNYPYFKSGVIVVTSGREGVFFLKKRAIDI